jgi:hypothetical protein
MRIKLVNKKIQLKKNKRKTNNNKNNKNQSWYKNKIKSNFKGWN